MELYFFSMFVFVDYFYGRYLNSVSSGKYTYAFLIEKTTTMYTSIFAFITTRLSGYCKNYQMSSGIMQCILLTIENSVTLMR